MACSLAWSPELIWSFPGGSVVKNLPVMQESQDTQVQPLSREDPVEEGMATHSSILAWRIPCAEEPGRLHSIASQRVRRDWSNLACTHRVNYFFCLWFFTIYPYIFFTIYILILSFSLLGFPLVSPILFILYCYWPNLRLHGCFMKYCSGLSSQSEQNSRRWWNTGKPGVLQSMGLHGVRHNSVTEQQQQQLQSIRLDSVTLQ